MEIENLLQFAERGELRLWLMENHSVEIFYSFDDKHYTMMRNCWLQDNTPVMVGMMAACPDGNGFKATFEHFKITHLPDQRRLEWLEKNKE